MKKRLILCTILIWAILAFIWGNSLLPGEISQAISNWVRSLLSGEGSGDGQGGKLLRKIAHFSEFTALGMCLLWRFRLRMKKGIHPFALGAAAACVDEIIQIFVPGRNPALLDVFIDSCGVLTGIILLTLGYAYKERKNNTQLEET